MDLISVTPDPTGSAGNKTAGIFAITAFGVAHVDPATWEAPGFQAKYGPAQVVSPQFYAALLASRTTVTVDATQLTASLVAALSDAGLLAREGAAIAHAEAVQEHADTPAA